MNYGPSLVRRVLDELGISNYRETNDWAAVKCPLHDDQHASMMIHLLEGGWKCMAGCGQSGDLAALVAEVTRQDVSVVRRDMLLKRGAEGDILESLLLPTEKSENIEPLYYDTTVIPDYLLNRGFSEVTLLEWRVGYDAVLDAAVIPVYVEGKLKGLIRRFTRGQLRYKYSKGFSIKETLFGWDKVPPGEKVFIVEGPLDAIYMHQAGYPALAVFGTQLSDWQADAIVGRWDNAYLMYDSDQPGRDAAYRAAEKLVRRMNLWVVLLPEGRKDPAECTSEELHKAVLNAQLVV